LKTLLKYRALLWVFLQSLGPWGVLLIAGLDGMGVPLPGAVDFVIVTYVYQKPANAWLYVGLAATGSAAGCLVLYLIGYLGGELLVEKRMDKQKFEKFRADFEDHPIVTLALPAVLPPPFPFKIFVLSAGAFEMRWTNFLAVIFVARAVRFGLLAVLTIFFGPGIITLFNNAFRKHPVLALVACAAFVAIFALVHRQRQARKRRTSPQIDADKR
jgi:membrane protein YqaA with SNARE-associated domain